MIKNRVVVKERDTRSDIDNFIGEMVAKYAGNMDFDNLLNLDIYLCKKWCRQLHKGEEY